MSDWAGSERRKDNNEILVEIHSDLKHLVKSYDGHIQDDKNNFGEINKKLEFQQKIVYAGMGILLFVEFIIKAVK